MKATNTPPSTLKRLPDGYRINKRPLLRASIPSPYTNAKSPKCVYVSARSPFISTVKRVRKIQKEIIKRTLGKTGLVDGENDPRSRYRSDKQKLRQVSVKESNPEAVFIKGTGKAIEKALSIGLYFQNQEDCRIELRTYSATAVDDIERVAQGDGNSQNENRKESVEGEFDEEPGETQVRGLSGIEIAVYLK